MIRMMKSKWFVPLVALLLLGVTLCLLAMQNWDSAEAPVFSKKSGFYQDAFYLEMTADNAIEIYYTLDGSVPDKTSLRYKEPVLINDATPNENVYSMRTDTSAGFYKDLLEKYQTTDAYPGYVPPDFPVDKCTVVRAVAYSNSGKFSQTTTATYFVDKDAGDFDANVISLVTAPENLFDEETGIYVTGTSLESYLMSGDVNPNWRMWKSNYRNRGQKWERPVELAIFDKEGNLLDAGEAGLRIHGGISRGLLPRGLNLYARAETGDNSSFNIAFSGSDYRAKRVTLNSGGNQTITLFPDVLMTEMTRGLNYASLEFEPCVLFINGEYWGFYWLSPKYDEQYIAYQYGVAEDNIIMVKNNTLELGKGNDLNRYIELKSFITGNDMSVAANYEAACELIDLDSFIDYYATMVYISREEDWPSSNFALWRTRTVVEDQEYADGKWRWMMFDCNSLCMRDDKGLTEKDSLQFVIESDPLFGAMWANDSFKALFEKRILEIGSTCFDKDTVSAYIDAYIVKMKPTLEKSWARFYGKNNTKEMAFYEMMESHRAFFNGRYETVSAWFQ